MRSAWRLGSVPAAAKKCFVNVTGNRCFRGKQAPSLSVLFLLWCGFPFLLFSSAFSLFLPRVGCVGGTTAVLADRLFGLVVGSRSRSQPTD